MDGTLHFASNNCASTSQGKAQIPNIDVYEDNAMLMEVGYGEHENIGAFLSGQFCEEFNHYVLENENVAPKKPCKVVQSSNPGCHPVVYVNITPTFQTEKNISSTRKINYKHI